MLEIPTDSGLQDFESQKQDYFSQIALEERSALRLHKEFGLLRRGASGEREWGNVAEHCLVETARARVFAELLGLNEELSRDGDRGLLEDPSGKDPTCRRCHPYPDRRRGGGGARGRWFSGEEPLGQDRSEIRLQRGLGGGA